MNSTLRNTATLGAGVLLLVVFLAVGALYEPNTDQPLCSESLQGQAGDPLTVITDPALQVVSDYTIGKYGWREGNFVVRKWEDENEYVVAHCSLLLDDEPRIGGSEYEFLVILDEELREVVQELAFQ